MDKNKIIEENIALVKSIASKFNTNKYLDFDDLVSIGIIGFLNALETYDPTKGCITTYAYNPIRWAIIKELSKFKNNEQNSISENYYEIPTLLFEYIPEKMTDREIDILQCYSEGRKTSEIANKLGITEYSVYRIFKKIKRKLEKANA